MRPVEAARGLLALVLTLNIINISDLLSKHTQISHFRYFSFKIRVGVSTPLAALLQGTSTGRHSAFAVAHEVMFSANTQSSSCTFNLREIKIVI